MRKRMFLSIVALCLTVALALSGCAIDVAGYFSNLSRMASGKMGTTTFDDMVYTRPDMTALQSTLEESCRIATESTDIREIEDAIWEFYEAYDNFYTMMNLADVRYCADLTDLYWQEEYSYCMSHSSEADAGLDELYYALAKSPMLETLEGDDYFGEGYFDSYQGESVWDETFTDLMTRESELISTYYDLSRQSLELEYSSEAFYETVGADLAQLYVELIALRQQIADYLGYDSYVQFTYDSYYYRDYTPEQAERYTEAIRENLVPLYDQISSSGIWDGDWGSYSEQDTFQYVKRTAEAMGGSIADSFRLLVQKGLYDISFGENKYDASFELYLYTYRVPFIFINPDGSAYDPLTFVHEFGHFCNDDVCGGSYAGTDVAEFFSQGMEYLSLCYGGGDENVRKLKMIDCLNIYVEQAAFAAFEQQVYALEGDDLTVENVQALYGQVCESYGFDSWGFDSRDYVTMPHYFTNPLYIISYVVSNDAAFQLYQMEQTDRGSGRALYQDNIKSQENYFLTFVENAGLESPFADGRVETVRQVLEQELG